MADGIELFGARLPLPRVTRVEVIDHTIGGAGRIFGRHSVPRVTVELQDDGRTLKVFLAEKADGSD